MAEPQPSAPSRAPYPVPSHGVTHVRARHTDRFTIVGNHLAQHAELTLTAIGLAVHIQSLPQGARVDIRTLAGRFPEGETRVAAALRELEAHGYLVRTRVRLPSGRIVTRTVAHQRPVPCPAGRTPRAARRPVTTARRPAMTSPALPAEPRRADRPAPVPSPAATTSPPPPEQAQPPEQTTPPPEQTPPPPEQTPPEQASPPRRAEVRAPVPRSALPGPPGPPDPVPLPSRRLPLPQPRRADPAGHRLAVSLLAGLHRDDARLLLAEPDVCRLAPAVVAWLQRGATAETVRRALTAGLPEPLHRPAALVAHRLAALAPMPAQPAPAPSSARPAPPPLRTCDGCDRAIRSATPGERCRDCRDAEPAPAEGRSGARPR